MPGTLAVASSWVELSFVGYVMVAGVFQVITLIPCSAVVVCVRDVAR